jgi:four helix bundle protein
MKDFRKLKVWDRSHRLAVEVYRATARFPRSELFGLASQMRRAAVSTPSNLAEGCGRRTDAELSRFSDIALGSASELEYQILLARDLGYLDAGGSAGLGNEVVEVKRMLGGFVRQLGRASREDEAVSG